MALWDFAEIKSVVRELTQRKSTAQLTDDALGKAVNQFYYYVFPTLVKPIELFDWYEFNTVASTDTYTMDDDESIVLLSPIYIAGDKANLYFDPEIFYDKFPQSQTFDEQQPTDALYYSGSIILRNPPDDVYSVKIRSIVRPLTFTSDTQTPTREEWGATIAYGTAIELLRRSRNMKAVLELTSQFDEHKSVIETRFHDQTFGSARPIAKF